MFHILILAFSFAASVFSHPHVHRHHSRALNYADTVILHHNIHRANHSAPDLTYDRDLETIAKTIASTCVFAHSMNIADGNYGQNIAAGVPADQVARVVTDLWYNRELPAFAGQWGRSDPDMAAFSSWGHMTQLVWKATTRVGCWTQSCPRGVAGAPGTADFTVCNYRGAGNFAGAFAENVGVPLGRAAVGV